jgi:hypothetical protein
VRKAGCGQRDRKGDKEKRPMEGMDRLGEHADGLDPKRQEGQPARSAQGVSGLRPLHGFGKTANRQHRMPPDDPPRSRL